MRDLVSPRACGPEGAGTWAGRAGGAGLLEAMLPGRARWEVGGEEFALLVMGEKDSDCCRGGKPCSCLMGYNSS